jgi:hypothetical protein
VATQWNGDAAYRAIEDGAAKGLLAAGVLFFNTHTLRVSRPNPPPHADSSKPGEYPRLRTGLGQRALRMVPTTVAEVARSGKVTLGYAKGDHHLLILELARDRLGLARTLEDLRPQLAALAVAEFKT